MTSTMRTRVAVYGWGCDVDASALLVYTIATSDEIARHLAAAAETYAREDLGRDLEPELWAVLTVPFGQIPPSPDECAAVVHVSESQVSPA